MATPGAINPVLSNARPGVSAKTTASFRTVTVDGNTTFAPGKGILNGTKSRDCNNTGYTTTLRPGLLLAKNSTTLKYATWGIGSGTGAITGASTTLSLAAAEVLELIRRVGASGTFVLTGPPTAGGTVRQVTVTYSAASGTSVTITALGVAKVERIRFATAATAGNLQLAIAKTDGTLAVTGSAAWSATDATYLANINTVLDAAGTAGKVVATAISAVDTDFGVELTYDAVAYPSGPAFAAQVALLPTGATAPVYTVTTAAVDGRFVTGSVVSETTESTPTTYVAEAMGVMLPADGTSDLDIRIPISAVVDYAQLLPTPSDAGLKLWIKQQISSLVGGKFAFDDSI